MELPRPEAIQPGEYLLAGEQVGLGHLEAGEDRTLGDPADDHRPSFATWMSWLKSWFCSGVRYWTMRWCASS